MPQPWFRLPFLAIFCVCVFAGVCVRMSMFLCRVHIHPSICISLYLPLLIYTILLCLSICLSIHPSIYPPIYLGKRGNKISVWLTVVVLILWCVLFFFFFSVFRLFALDMGYLYTF